MSAVRTLKARCVFPVAGEPILDGAVSIRRGSIVEVGKAAAGGQAEDLGNVAILPGLVNAHTHLEFSDLTQPLGEPGISLPDWIRRVIDFRGRSDQSVSGAVQRGLRESLRHGTTTLGEIAQPGWPVDRVAGADLDTTVFLELIAPTTQRVAPALELARQHLQASRPTAGWRPGLSPHAPYSVHPALLAAVVSLSAAKRVPLAFHLAESREELELLGAGGGPLRELLVELGAWEAGAIRPGGRPLDYLCALAPAYRALVIHGNYLDDEEIAFLARHSRKMAVVYCPRTHARFAHQRYPLQELLSAGVAVALGTDGRASSPDLSILAEMRHVAASSPEVGPAVVLQLGTIRAARALGRGRHVGSLEPGKYADLAVVGLPERDAADPYDLLFNSDKPVVATWRRGRPVGQR